MFVTAEEALAVHEARHKLRTTRNGECWLFAPYMPSACYSLGHFTDDGWKQCDGPGKCAWHHRKLIPKGHVVALCIKKAFPYTKFPLIAPPKQVPFVGPEWEVKIMELTGGIIKAFMAGRDKPDRLCVVGRKTGPKNLPMELRWLDSVLTGVPSGLVNVQIPEVLPGIIKGEYAYSAERSDLDKPDDSGIKHKTGYQPDVGRNSGDDDGAGASAPGPASSPRIGPGGRKGKAGAA